MYFLYFRGLSALNFYPGKGIPLQKRAAQRADKEDELRGVSLLIPAYNEEFVIEKKIKNTLLLDYPKHKIEIVIASDGSDDKTNEIVKRYSDRVKLIAYEKREGKTLLLNKTVPKLKNEIIVFSDASAMLDADAIQKIIPHFQDESIGV